MPKFLPGNQLGGGGPGRPKGSRSRLHAGLDKRAGQNAGRILQATLTAALNGDVSAQRALLDRIWPSPRGSFVFAELPFLASSDDVTQAAAIVVGDLASGKLRSDEGETLLSALKAFVQIKTGLEIGAELEALSRRLAQLETMKGATGGEIKWS